MKKSFFLLIIALLVASVPASLDAKSKKKRGKRRAATEQVWKHISGMYNFSDGETYIMIDHFQGESKATIGKADYSESKDYPCTVDEKTGLITICDDAGKVIFTGKMYRGGNQLKGTLNGKKVVLEGMCGA